MVKKNRLDLENLTEIENKIKELKLELANFKGLLASKTKSNNTSKKTQLRKQIARHLTLKNEILKKEKIKKK